jgi:hypothetical protein
MMIWGGGVSAAISLFSLFSLFFHRIISEEDLVFGGNPGLLRGSAADGTAITLAVPRSFSLFLPGSIIEMAPPKTRVPARRLLTR